MKGVREREVIDPKEIEFNAYLDFITNTFVFQFKHNGNIIFEIDENNNFEMIGKGRNYQLIQCKGREYILTRFKKGYEIYDYNTGEEK